MAPNDEEMACDEVDALIEHLRNRRDNLKRKIRTREEERIRRMEEDTLALRRENAQLQERLIAARDVRRQLDQQTRSNLLGSNTPAGQALLHY